MCRRGLSNHCRNRTVLGIDGHDGAFAEYLAVPVHNLHEVPASVSDEQAVMVEPLAAACQIARQVKIDVASNVVVLGDGRLAQLVVRRLKPLLGHLLMVGKHATKLEAAEKQGVATVRVGDFVPTAKADVVVDATGSADGFALAMKTVRPRGTIVLKSTVAAESGMNLAPLVINEISVIGSRCGPFPAAIKALASGKVDVSALVSKVYPLAQAAEALSEAGNGQSIKVLIHVP